LCDERRHVHFEAQITLAAAQLNRKPAAAADTPGEFGLGLGPALPQERLRITSRAKSNGDDQSIASVRSQGRELGKSFRGPQAWRERRAEPSDWLKREGKKLALVDRDGHIATEIVGL
jgi:hypothetical protein